MELNYRGYINNFNGAFHISSEVKYYLGEAVKPGDFWIFNCDSYDDTNKKYVQLNGVDNKGRRYYNQDFFYGDILLVTAVNVSKVEYERIATTHRGLIANVSFKGMISTLDEFDIANNAGHRNVGDTYIIAKDFASLGNMTEVKRGDIIVYKDKIWIKYSFGEIIGDIIQKHVDQINENINQLMAGFAEEFLRFGFAEFDRLEDARNLKNGTLYHVTPKDRSYTEINGKKFKQVWMLYVNKDDVRIFDEDTLRTLDALRQGSIPALDHTLWNTVIDSGMIADKNKITSEKVLVLDKPGDAVIKEVIYGYLEVKDKASVDANRVLVDYDPAMRWTLHKVYDDYVSDKTFSFNLKAPANAWKYEDWVDIKDGVDITLPRLESKVVGILTGMNIGDNYLTKSVKDGFLRQSLLREENDEILIYDGKSVVAMEFMAKDRMMIQSTVALEPPAYGILEFEHDETTVNMLPHCDGTLVNDTMLDTYYFRGHDTYIPKLNRNGVDKAYYDDSYMHQEADKLRVTSDESIHAKKDLTLNGEIVAYQTEAEDPEVANHVRHYAKNLGYRSFEYDVDAKPKAEKQIDLKRANVILPIYGGNILTDEGPIDGGLYE